MHAYAQLAQQGLWKNNVGLVQLIGLCPLLATSTSVINGLGLGLATTMILIGSNLLVSLFRAVIPPAVRIPIFVLIIASMVTSIDLTMKAFFYGLYQVLGIFIPLIVVNCAVIGRAEAFASKNREDLAVIDGLFTGLGFTGVLVLLGGMRELLGHGTLLAHADLMFGAAGAWLQITLIEDYRGFLLAVLPPGAFIGLALLIAAKNALEQRLAQSRPAPVTRLVPPVQA